MFQTCPYSKNGRDFRNSLVMWHKRESGLFQLVCGRVWRWHRWIWQASADEAGVLDGGKLSKGSRGR